MKHTTTTATTTATTTKTLTITERHEDGSVHVYDDCDARFASILLETAWEIVYPPYEVVQAFVLANDQGENLLGI